MTETVAPAPTPAPAPAPAPPTRNLIGLIALTLAIVGFVFAVIPVIAFIAWLPLLAAFILSIIGLTRKGQSKGTSIAALIISVVGWIVSIIVSLVVVGTAITSDSSTTVQPGSPTSSAVPGKLPGVGATVTNRDGIAFTLTAVQCGQKSAPQIIYGTVTPNGDFCQVDFTVMNGSKQSIDLSSDSLEGYIGTTKYDASDKAGHFGSDTIYSTLNPGLSSAATLYVDVPVGATLDTVKLNTSFGIGTAVTIAAK